MPDVGLGVPIRSATPALIDLPEADYDGTADLFFHIRGGVGVTLRQEDLGLPDTIGSISVDGRIAAVFHSDVLKRGSETERRWAEALEARTGQTLAREAEALHTELNALRQLQSWRTSRPVLNECLDSAAGIYRKWT
jgi:hypothetical protein